MTQLQAKAYARQMRKSPTPAEDFFWEHTRNRQIGNLKFRRQHPLRYYDMHGNELYFIVDFLCKSNGLVVEIDGSIHDDQQEIDQARTDIITNDYGYFVLRFSNEEVINEWEKVASKLYEFSKEK